MTKAIPATIMPNQFSKSTSPSNSRNQSRVQSPQTYMNKLFELNEIVQGQQIIQLINDFTKKKEMKNQENPHQDASSRKSTETRPISRD